MDQRGPEGACGAPEVAGGEVGGAAAPCGARCRTSHTIATIATTASVVRANVTVCSEPSRRTTRTRVVRGGGSAAAPVAAPASGPVPVPGSGAPEPDERLMLTPS